MNITKQDLVNTYTRALADAGVTPEEGLHERAQTLADIAWDIKERQPLEQSLENLASYYGVDKIPDDADIQAIIAELTDDSMSGPRVERKSASPEDHGCVDCCEEMAYDIARAMVKQRRKHREKGRLFINPKLPLTF